MGHKRVAALLGMIAEQSHEVVSEDRIEFLLSRLEGLDLGKLEVALSRILESARRFPTVAEIKAEMGEGDATARDRALLVADRVIAGITKLGEVTSVGTAAAVPLVIGQTAFEVVQAMGGWNHVVNMAENIGVLRAQIRDIAEAGFKTGRFEGSPEGEDTRSAFQAIREANRRLEAGILSPPSKPLQLMEMQ
jgi:hypothetical protein